MKRLTLVTTGCAGLTAREKGALVDGADGAAGSAAIGAAIGGPVSLLGGYLLGDRFFTTDAGRKKEP